MNDGHLPSAGFAAAQGNEPARPKGVSLEVPVTLQGLTGPGGSQTFLEETRTVLVMAQGAVVRLGTEVTRGQELVLRNPRTKQEALARVVLSRSHPNTKGYAEVEFTQPAPGFWGMSFPSEMPARATPQPLAPPAARLQLAGAAATSNENQPKPFVTSQSKPSSFTRDQAPISAPAMRSSIPAAPAQAPRDLHLPKSSPPPQPSYERVDTAPEMVPLADAVKRNAAVRPAAAALATPVAPVAVMESPAASFAPAKTVSPSFGPKETTEVFTLRVPQLGESARSAQPDRVLRALIFTALASVALAGGAGFLRYTSSATNSEGAVLESAAPPASGAPESVPPASSAPGTDTSASSVPAAAPLSTPAETSANAAIIPSATPDAPSAPAETLPAESARRERRTAPVVKFSAPIVDSSKAGPGTVEPVPNVEPEGISASPVAAPALPMAFSNAKAPPPPAPPLRVGGRAEPPKLISSPPPVYPLLARAQRMEGDVILDASIDAKGNVTKVSVVSGHALLQQAAIDAVKRWRYEPARLNGEPVPTQVQVRIFFRP